MRKKNKINIIIPIKNESKNLIILFKLLKRKVKNSFFLTLCYDDSKDDIHQNISKLKKIGINFVLLKNLGKGPNEAVKTALLKVKTKCCIVYPADDFKNINLIDLMIKKFDQGYDIVAPSRFMKKGSMKNCPLLKGLMVRLASFSLYKLSSIPIEDASNGFRLFSKKLIKKISIESKLGFAYSLEILVKCNRLNLPIIQIPATWEERIIGKSNFAIFKWFREYLRWYFYGIKTYWLNEKKINLK
jgi:dolichol-phosphate mannosyltransferase